MKSSGLIEKMHVPTGGWIEFEWGRSFEEEARMTMASELFEMKRL